MMNAVVQYLKACTRSSMYNEDKVPKVDLWVMPHWAIFMSDRNPDIKTYCFLFVTKELSHLLSSPLIP